MNRTQVLNSFLNKETAKTPLREVYGWTHKGRTLTSDGEKLVNYNTIIAYFKGDTLHLNMTRYSNTTSHIQHELRRLAENKGIKIEEYLQVSNYTEY